MPLIKKFKFHKGYSTLDSTTTRKLTQIAKMVLEPRLGYEESYNQRVLESLIKMQAKSFFNIIDFKYSVTAPGKREELDGYDTGKQVYSVVFKEENSRPYGIRMHWILMRGLKEPINDHTIFYSTSSSDE